MAFSLFSKNIGIDLGTSNTLIYAQGKGIVLNEPSVVAIDKAKNEVISVGVEAQNMLGRTPGNIIAVRPMRDGVIADFEIVEKMIRYFIGKIVGRRSIIKPRVVIGIPTGITEVERRAVQESCEQAGAREIILIEEPLAAAIGSGMPTGQPLGNMIVDVGGGTTEIAVISLGSIVLENSIRVGGNQIDKNVGVFVRSQHNMILGDRTIENLKKNFIDIWNFKDKETYFVKGRDSITGLPRSQELNKQELKISIDESLKEIISAIKLALDRTPPELAADIIDQGIMLSGGGAYLKGLKEYISNATSVPVIQAKDPLECVVRGTGIFLEEYNSTVAKKGIKI